MFVSVYYTTTPFCSTQKHGNIVFWVEVIQHNSILNQRFGSTPSFFVETHNTWKFNILLTPSLIAKHTGWCVTASGGQFVHYMGCEIHDLLHDCSHTEQKHIFRMIL